MSRGTRCHTGHPNQVRVCIKAVAGTPGCKRTTDGHPHPTTPTAGRVCRAMPTKEDVCIVALLQNKDTAVLFSKQNDMTTLTLPEEWLWGRAGLALALSTGDRSRTHKCISPAVCAGTSSPGWPSPSGPEPRCIEAPGTWLWGLQSGALTHPKALAASGRSAAGNGPGRWWR